MPVLASLREATGETRADGGAGPARRGLRRAAGGPADRADLRPRRAPAAGARHQHREGPARPPARRRSSTPDCVDWQPARLTPHTDHRPRRAARPADAGGRARAGRRTSRRARSAPLGGGPRARRHGTVIAAISVVGPVSRARQRAAAASSRGRSAPPRLISTRIGYRSAAGPVVDRRDPPSARGIGPQSGTAPCVLPPQRGRSWRSSRRIDARYRSRPAHRPAARRTGSWPVLRVGRSCALPARGPASPRTRCTSLKGARHGI